MTIEVEAPDGSIVEFPDGTPDDVMAAAMRKAFGGPEQPSAPAAVARNPVTGRPVEPISVDTSTGPLQAADDIARLAANGLTFGYADKIAGALGGDGTDAERARTEEARQRAGSAGTVAEIGSAAAIPIGAGNAGLTLAGRFGTGAMKGLGGLAARSALMGAEGAGYGALTAAGNDQPIDDGALLGAIFGAGGNVAAEGIGKGLGWLASNVGRPAPPTMADVAAARDAAYQAADDAGVIFTPDGLRRVRNGLNDRLADFGYDPVLQPGAGPALNRLRDAAGELVTKQIDEVAAPAADKTASMLLDEFAPPSAGSAPQRVTRTEVVDTGRPTTLKDLDQMRKVANHGYQQGNRSNNAVVNMIVNAIDDLAENPGAGDVMAGNAGTAADALGEARGLARRAIKASEIEDAIVRASRRAASTGKGGNIDNATRQNIRQILDRGARGYTPDEVAAMEKVVFGTPTQNVLRWAGGFSPQNILNGSVGLGAGGAVGGAIGGPGGALIGGGTVATIGGLAKLAADAATRGNVDDLIETIMRGGTALPPNAAQRAIKAATPDLARIIMSGGNVEANR
jgi:hypothetical protein